MNKKNSNYYYIASPGFNQEQLDIIHKIEKSLDNKFDYFSPFTHGGKLETSSNLEDTKVSVKNLFDENMDQLDQATNLIAVVDPQDKGTFFEIGYFIGKYGDLSQASHRMLLYGDKTGKCSFIICNVYNKFKSILQSGVQFIVLDITEKTIDAYLLMGMLYACGITIITWSDGQLDHNLMTACAAAYHYNYYKEGYNAMTASELQYYLMTRNPYDEDPMESRILNLSNLKLASKIE